MESEAGNPLEVGGRPNPVAAERLEIALEPTAEYELRADGGGCEDPRITFVEPLQRYVMTYIAFSSKGPRIALAISDDLFHWERLDLGHPSRIDVYYGMADRRIGAARLDVPTRTMRS